MNCLSISLSFTFGDHDDGSLSRTHHAFLLTASQGIFILSEVKFPYDPGVFSKLWPLRSHPED